MPVDTAISLVGLIRQHRLLESAQLDELAGKLAQRFPEPRALAKELLQRDWLTPYQINQLFQGRGDELTLENYILLERLGEGGMGQVFKARHSKLGTLVALKLIHRNRVPSEESLRRFRREMSAACTLDHPNIVHAVDAGEKGGALYFAMEYLQGIDLAKLVKQRGPLPVPEACDYARQSALGLQHAFERGLVHRDIKPANLLLLMKERQIKILDFGLARLDGLGDGEPSSTLTQTGSIMGTPDYISPEQARNSHSADIRSDLYSLGCTLYFLLAGHVPFPGGALTEKLLQHQLDEPAPLVEVRPDVPLIVAAVVHKLMAKKVEDRYQMPAEVAQALAVGPSGAKQSGIVSSVPSNLPACASPESDTVISASYKSGSALVKRGRSSWPILLGAAALFSVLVFGGILTAALWWASKRTLEAPAKPVATADKVKPAEREKPPEPEKPPERLDPKKSAAELKKLGATGLAYDSKAPDKALRLKMSKPNISDADLVHLTAFPRLEDIDLTGTGIGDAALKHLRALKRLRRLSLSRTRVTDAGLEQLRNLTELRELYLDDLQITGAGLVHLKDMAQLVKLSLARTQTNDAGLAYLKPLLLLQWLNLAETPVTGEGLRQLKDIPNLRDLDLLHTNTTGADLGGIVQLPHLTRLVLQETKIDDANLERLLKLTKLQDLHLGGTAITDAGLQKLRGMARLKSLDLEHTAITDAGLVNLKSMKSLQVLLLGSTPITGAGLVHLEGLTALNTLSLSETQITEADLIHLKDLKALTSLQLANTRIGDEGLAQLTICSLLKSLGLDRTDVTDAGLPQLEKLTKLTDVSLTGTKTTDEGIGALKKALPKVKITR